MTFLLIIYFMRMVCEQKGGVLCQCKNNKKSKKRQRMFPKIKRRLAKKQQRDRMRKHLTNKSLKVTTLRTAMYPSCLREASPLRRKEGTILMMR